MQSMRRNLRFIDYTRRTMNYNLLALRSMPRGLRGVNLNIILRAFGLRLGRLYSEVVGGRRRNLSGGGSPTGIIAPIGQKQFWPLELHFSGYAALFPILDALHAARCLVVAEQFCKLRRSTQASDDLLVSFDVRTFSHGVCIKHHVYEKSNTAFNNILFTWATIAP